MLLRGLEPRASGAGRARAVRGSCAGHPRDCRHSFGVTLAVIWRTEAHRSRRRRAFWQDLHILPMKNIPYFRVCLEFELLEFEFIWVLRSSRSLGGALSKTPYKTYTRDGLLPVRSQVFACFCQAWQIDLSLRKSAVSVCCKAWQTIL